MLLKSNDFITYKEMVFNTLGDDEMFIKPHGKRHYYIHELEFGFGDGNFGEYFFIRDRVHPLDSIMKILNDGRVGRFSNLNLRTFFKENGNIISANLVRVTKYKAYIVYVEEDTGT